MTCFHLWISFILFRYH